MWVHVCVGGVWGCFFIYILTHGLQALGVAIQCGSPNPLNDALPILAQRACDPIPSVRSCLAEVVGGWLLDMVDRCSHIHTHTCTYVHAHAYTSARIRTYTRTPYMHTHAHAMYGNLHTHRCALYIYMIQHYMCTHILCMAHAKYTATRQIHS